MTSFKKFQSPYILKVLAYNCTSSAINTFPGIENNRRGGFIFFKFSNIRVIGNSSDAKISSQILKFTCSISSAGQTFHRMIGNNHLKYCPPYIHNFRIMSDIILSLHYFCCTGPNHFWRTFNFTYTNSAGSPCIKILGWVPETAPHLTRALVSIAPLRYGSGMKGKIGEAFSYGVPVVTTSVGAEGIGIVNGVHALVADTPEEFANAVCRLIEDEALWNRLSTAGKRLLEERWGSARMRERLQTFLSELLAGEKPASRETRREIAAASEGELERERPSQDLERSPTYIEALETAESGDLNRAIQLLTIHLNERPDHAGGWSDLGVLHYHDGNLTEARKCFEKALATPGGWRTVACENFVECLLASGEREQARGIASRWLEEAADMAEPWLLWARLNFEGDRLGEAREAAKRALSIDPTNETAEAYLSQIDDAEKTLSAPPEDASTASAALDSE